LRRLVEIYLKNTPAVPDVTKGSRIAAVDLARTAAIVGMVIFHIARDLEFFGQLPPGTTLAGGWALLARTVAGSFLFLTGFSLVLAHGGFVRWRPFLRRLVTVGLAALAISVVTRLALPDRFIYFGILHAIFFCSIIGICFVWVQASWSALGALIVWCIWAVFARSLDLPIWMAWTGLRQSVPPSLDFIPVFPWLAPCLLGIAMAKVTSTYWKGQHSTGPVLDILTWPGRHSLSIYLLHQPIILGALWVVIRFYGAG